MSRMHPILYQSHSYIIYSYPLLMGFGWGVGYQIFKSQVISFYTNIKFHIFFLGLFIAAWFGAKILFLITAPEMVSNEATMSLSFWMGGGFVYYGGLILSLVFILGFHLFIQKLNSTIIWALALSLSFGHAIGRIGCFMAGCCFGKKTNWLWGVFMNGEYRHPTQLLEAIGLIIIGTYLYRSKKGKFQLITDYIVLYGVLRFLVELLRGDTIRGVWLGQSPSLIISTLLILAGVVLKNINKNRYL